MVELMTEAPPKLIIRMGLPNERTKNQRKNVTDVKENMKSKITNTHRPKANIKLRGGGQTQRNILQSNQSKLRLFTVFGF